MLQGLEVATGLEPVGTVIWMHGLGADGYDFVPIVRELGLPDELPLRFVFPHAPVQPVTINGGYRMRAWYDIRQADIGRQPDEAGIRASAEAVAELVAREGKRGVPAERVVLAGFSQGGAIALQLGLRYPQRLAGVMALSSYLPLADTLAAEAHPANRDVPVFMGHGHHDEIVPIALARSSLNTLQQQRYSIEWHDYPMPHSVCAEEIRDIGHWLQKTYRLQPRNT